MFGEFKFSIPARSTILDADVQPMERAKAPPPPPPVTEPGIREGGGDGNVLLVLLFPLWMVVMALLLKGGNL